MLWRLCLGTINVYYVPIGPTIRRLRGERPQEDLAHEAGISTSTLSRIERGLHEPALATLRKLAVALGVSLVELVEAAESTSRQREATDRDPL
jgi:transcriptional regulator with XRE-family HTH domain